MKKPCALIGLPSVQAKIPGQKGTKILKIAIVGRGSHERYFFLFFFIFFILFFINKFFALEKSERKMLNE